MVQSSRFQVQSSRFMPSLSSWTEFTEWRICKRQQNNCQAHVHRCFLRQHDKDCMNLERWLKAMVMALNLKPWTLNLKPWTLTFNLECGLWKSMRAVWKSVCAVWKSMFVVQMWTDVQGKTWGLPPPWPCWSVKLGVEMKKRNERFAKLWNLSFLCVSIKKQTEK